MPVKCFAQVCWTFGTWTHPYPGLARYLDPRPIKAFSITFIFFQLQYIQTEQPSKNQEVEVKEPNQVQAISLSNGNPVYQSANPVLDINQNALPVPVFSQNVKPVHENRQNAQPAQEICQNSKLEVLQNLHISTPERPVSKVIKDQQTKVSIFIIRFKAEIQSFVQVFFSFFFSVRYLRLDQKSDDQVIG